MNSANGAKYVGQLKDGKMHGFGKLITPRRHGPTTTASGRMAGPRSRERK